MDDVTKTTTLDDLSSAIMEHLAETDADYYAQVGAWLGLDIADNKGAYTRIGNALETATPGTVVSLANHCLSGEYALREDGTVIHVTTAEQEAGPSF